MRNSIRTRLAIAFIALTASLLLLVGLVLAWQSYVTEQEQALAIQSEWAQRISAEVVSYMQIQENALTQLVSVRGLGDLDQEQQTQLLSGLISYSNAYNKLALLNNNGLELIVVSHTEVINQLNDLSTNVEFTYPKATKQIYYSPVRIFEKTGEPYIVISVPIMNLLSGSVTNVLIAEVGFKPVWDLLANLALGEKSNAYIVDADNRVIAHNNPSIVLRNTHFTIPDQNGLHTGLDGANVVLSTDRIKLGEQEFTVVTETPVSEAFANIIRTELTIFALLVVAIVIAGGLGWFAARQIVQPIESLVKTAHDVSAGDLSKLVEVTRHDEIGHLAEAFNRMITQLRDLIGSLEQRVVDRTADLEMTTSQSRKRAEQLQAVSEVARAVSTEVNLENLLTLVTNVVNDRFGFYHVGVFLIDEVSKNAVLRASNSPGGKRMVAHGHKLQIGQVGIVGHVAATGEPRIALDVGDDAIYFNNPDLPETRSEIALPLSVRGRIIGVLDVQSTQPNAFTPADVETLSILADQVAIAIENARLLADSQQALAESQSLYGEYIGRTWGRKTAQSPIGYYYASGAGQLLNEAVEWDEVRNVLKTGQPIVTTPSRKSHTTETISTVTVPIRLQNQVIGILDIRSVDPDRTWTEDEIAVIEATAERLALALENARLFEETSSRAAREHAVAKITSKIRNTNDPQIMIRTAIEELQRVLGASRVEIVPQVVSAHLPNREHSNDEPK